ncbi:hypothetical protein AGRA3207_004480 [Actinomadura graeca]|uniref:Guanylate cyclase domain-containing protein n=1 Tax=Actinomadura graeca TaxID=2750812 RepID=A0ABX8QWX7_9ACTN|nr:hypothetical protein [Actinomadura graeca]QXJ23339.1 hypothetical protein AGRA3207_004480 [Actinomadura graeca]
MKPRYRTCFAVDIRRYTGRDPASQARVRDAMHEIVRAASQGARVPWRSDVGTDRGDGVLVVTGKVGVEVLFGDFIRKLGGGVRGHNLLAAPGEQMQLRVALDGGYLNKDPQGYSGDALNRAARMLDAPDFTARMDDRAAEFAVITSDDLYEVVRGYHLLDDKRLDRIQVEVKETRTTAWMWIP